jgi:acetyl-CoA acetyltransferase
MGLVSDKIAALKTAFDAAVTRVEAKIANDAATPADFASIDDMTTRATGLAADATPPVEPAPMPPVPPTP